MGRLNMFEYIEKHAVARVIGAPPGHVEECKVSRRAERIVNRIGKESTPWRSQ